MSWGPLSLRTASHGIVFEGEASPAPGGGSMPLQVHHTQLSDADIKALPDDGSNLPIVLTPVPDAGTMIMPMQAVIVGPSVAYTNINAGALLLIEAADVSAIEIIWFESTGMVTQLIGQSGARSLGVGLIQQQVVVDGTFAWADGADIARYDGMPWQLAADNGGDMDFTGGDPANVMDVYVYYVVVPVA